MGKNNRQRRADKRRARANSSGPGRPPRPADYLDDRDVAEILVLDAACSAERGLDDFEAALLALTTVREDVVRPGWSAMVDNAMKGCLTRSLRSAWDNGWQPADIVRAARKRLDAAHAEVAAAVITAEARISAGPGVAVPETWAAQLRQLDDGAQPAPSWTNLASLRIGAGLLGMLLHLPALPHLVPTPSQWGRGRPRLASGRPDGGNGGDGRMLAKVRALLAKAESTDFEEEANALTAKAQELMARHAIDQAMLADDKPGTGPVGRRIGVDDPYFGAKANLLQSVAGANRCKMVTMDGYGFATVFGFSGDLDIVEMLYTSLLVQATRAMTAAGSVRDRTGTSRTRSFRQSFLMAFAARIGERLRTATTVATEAATAVHGDALLPVLSSRLADVDDAVAAAFPHVVWSRVAVSNWDGWVAGRVAADQARLGPEHELFPGVAV